MIASLLFVDVSLSKKSAWDYSFQRKLDSQRTTDLKWFLFFLSLSLSSPEVFQHRREEKKRWIRHCENPLHFTFPLCVMTFTFFFSQFQFEFPHWFLVVRCDAIWFVANSAHFAKCNQEKKQTTVTEKRTLQRRSEQQKLVDNWSSVCVCVRSGFGHHVYHSTMAITKLLLNDLANHPIQKSDEDNCAFGGLTPIISRRARETHKFISNRIATGEILNMAWLTMFSPVASQHMLSLQLKTQNTHSDEWQTEIFYWHRTHSKLKSIYQSFAGILEINLKIIY